MGIITLRELRIRAEKINQQRLLEERERIINGPDYWELLDQQKRADIRRYKQFGVTPQDYDRMLAEQGGVCAICGNTETTKRGGKVRSLSIDHCHQSGKVRGLLCQGCNTALGMLREDPERVKSMLQYIEERCLE